MIQGYAIYLRTHRKTGKQYAGAVWGSKSNWIAEKAVLIRWKTEDRKGIQGLFGGFDSQILLSEKRSDAPEMSDGLYRFRIAADETHIVDRIPILLRLNKMSPLITGAALTQELSRLGARRVHELYPTSAAANAKKAQINKRGIFGLSFDQRSENSKRIGNRAKAKGRGYCSMTHEQHQEAGFLGGSRGGQIGSQTHRKNKTGVFSQKHQARASKIRWDREFIKTVAWG